MSKPLPKINITLEEFDRVWIPSESTVNELAERWEAMWDRLGLTPRTGSFETVFARWNEPHRGYHTPRHLLETLRVYEILSPYSEAPDLGQVALWHHDVIYNVNQGDNEERSADLAYNTFVKCGGDVAQGEEIRKMVISTSHRYRVSNIEAAIVVDADLAILGSTPERFDEYEEQVRREYPSASEPHYVAGRLKAMTPFLDRPTLFRTPLLRDLLEARGRENLTRSLGSLRAKAAKLSP